MSGQPAYSSTASSPASHSPGTLSRTTPFPNRLLDEVMPRLNDTQWRLLCVIVRQTLGWQRSGGSDSDGNTRKQWDWLTREQLKRRTGRNAEALAAAIDTLTRQGYIVTRSSHGQMLATARERRQNQSRIYYSLSPQVLHWLKSDNASRSNHAVAAPRSLCSKIEHGNSNIEGDTASSVYRADHRKIEHGDVGKSNTTKQTQTKETNTKKEQSHSFQGRSPERSHALQETAQQAFDKTPATVPETAALEAATPQVKDFVRLVEKLYAQQKQARPQSTLCAADWQRLHTLLHKHPGLNWEPILEQFFASDLGYVTRHNHSLLSFLNLCNFFLLHIPGVLGPKNTGRKESGWQRALPLSPGTIDQPNASL